MHSSREDQYGTHHHPHVGLAAAGALCLHSFLDGVGIGLAFQVDERVGVARRGTFLIDPEGTIRWSLVSGIGERRDFSGYHDALARA